MHHESLRIREVAGMRDRRRAEHHRLRNLQGAHARRHIGGQRHAHLRIRNDRGRQRRRIAVDENAHAAAAQVAAENQNRRSRRDRQQRAALGHHAVIAGVLKLIAVTVQFCTGNAGCGSIVSFSISTALACHAMVSAKGIW